MALTSRLPPDSQEQNRNRLATVWKMNPMKLSA